MLKKLLITLTTFSICTVCAGQEIYLSCDGDRYTEIVDRDAETRRDILRVRELPKRRDTQTYVVRGGKVFAPGGTKEVGNCEVGQFLIKCNRPLNEDFKDYWRFYSLEINRISGLISEHFGAHAYGGRVDSRDAVQISITCFDGNCKGSGQLAF